MHECRADMLQRAGGWVAVGMEMRVAWQKFLVYEHLCVVSCLLSANDRDRSREISVIRHMHLHKHSLFSRTGFGLRE